MNEATRTGRLGAIDPLLGVTLSGRYVVNALVGQGGMGKVYEAQQIPLGRSVALKVLDARHVDREFHRRFFQEAAILARLKSRYTVTIYDYGRDGDLYFIAMELVAGQSLDRLLATEAPLAVPRAVMIAEQICKSLREAHSQGVIHRDLKPANVMLSLTEDGEEHAKVLDFGLAKRLDRNSQDETHAHVVPGSPKYMAPEAIRQQPIDGRVDMYALGVMLYYMLSGVVPFERENPMDILRAHLHEAPRALRVANPKVDVPETLERVVMRCLAKNPDERFANMQELLDTLRAFSRSLQRPSAPRWAPGTGGHAPLNQVPSTMPPPATSPQSLHLDRRDARAPAKSSFASPDASRARGVWVAGAVCAFAIVAGAIWKANRSDAATAVVTTPLAPPVKAPPPPAAPMPSMVITPEEVAEQARKYVLHVSSTPAGAAVFVQGKRVGRTPGDFDYEAKSPNDPPIVVQVKRAGYAPYVIKRALDAKEIQIAATLAPAPRRVDLATVDVRARTTESDAPPAPGTESGSDTAAESEADDSSGASDNPNEPEAEASAAQSPPP